MKFFSNAAGIRPKSNPGCFPSFALKSKQCVFILHLVSEFDGFWPKKY